ncbi:Coenzyme A biosynthesis bifunctional protein CoaBC [Novipirellula aureliae]|uniref:Coenzyme A biosynthesis bifunctional protein CoaBC n=1 Tax=Novipirellula aureliae TaxID=2527966 RepID=A0A5C6E2H1_9BACT|nr:phosphopantothenoylcysteine decarboxylase [Novipirellula aureliae]TWU43058.1 Coenzyme A biosynthesis bifunctional protein CoaBC [Novipirellula aureliae]
MSRILITSGPTRQYLDPVRYLTNASSGRMGSALAAAAIAEGHQVVIVSGPVSVAYPAAAEIINVETTDEMLTASMSAFESCDGAIGAAAPCDYMPRFIQTQKIAKTGDALQLELIETADVVAMLGQRKKQGQWVVGFALETEDRRFRATVKLQKKCCDWIVSNGPQAIDSDQNDIELLNRHGDVILTVQGTKEQVATELMKKISEQLPDEKLDVKR